MSQGVGLASCLPKTAWPPTSLTHLPVILDPSHSTGDSAYVASIAKAAIAAGADGLIVEVHNDPAHALSDGRQSLTPENFARLVRQVKSVAEAVDRKLAPVNPNRIM